MSGVHRITDALEKPELDNRSYRAITLPNELEALLVHDPETDKASASLNVNVGSFADGDMPGKAHAVEHMLFKGSKKYPAENEFDQYLSTNSGDSNGSTAATQTTFYFQCSAFHGANNDTGQANGTSSPLYGALDRFSQFFIRPLFLSNALDGVVKIVDSEYKGNLQDEMRRQRAVTKFLSNPKHPYHHFHTGNLHTLQHEPAKHGVNVRDAFVEFYDNEYSANRMKLVVLGREPLDVLEGYVSEFFAEVENKNLPEMRWDDVQPLTKDKLLTQIFIKPIRVLRNLTIQFPFVDELAPYMTQPELFVGHLIGHDGPGGIVSFLKKKGLASTLWAEITSICPGVRFFSIEISLTPLGLGQYYEVVKIVFQYIAMMKGKPPQEWIYKEIQIMADAHFRFREKSAISTFTKALSSEMQRSLPREWLLSSDRLRKFDTKTILKAWDCLRDDNFRLVIESQDFPGNWDEKESWYNTDYKVEKVPADVRSQISQVMDCPAADRPLELHLPHENEFLPTCFDVDRQDVKEPAKAPKLICNDNTMRLWWKKDDTFWAPKAYVDIVLRSSRTYATPANYVKALLHTELVKDALTEYSYYATLAGLDYAMQASMLGIEVCIYGSNHKMHILLEKVITTLRHLEIKPDRFEVIKDKMMRAYKGWRFGESCNQAHAFSLWLVYENIWFEPQCEAELRKIKLEDVASFFPQLLQHSHLEMLAYGNLYKRDAMGMGTNTKAILKSQELPSSQWPSRRNVIIPPGSNYVYLHKLEDPANVNHAIEYTLHIGSVSNDRLRAELELFAQLLDEPCYDQLRTKEQLGYVVERGGQIYTNILVYRIMIQSEQHPDVLEQRIDDFLLKFGDTLATMSIDIFEDHRCSAINTQLMKPQNMASESSRLWTYIQSEVFDFYQIDAGVKELRALSKQNIQEFYEHFISPRSSVRAKTCVHVLAQASSLAYPVADIVSKATVIDDVAAWKAGLELSSGPKPASDIMKYEK